MITSAIVAVLSAIAIPMYSDYALQSSQADAIATMMEIDLAVNRHFSNNFSYPDSLDEIGFGDEVDPWGNAFGYLKIEGAAKGVKGKVRKDKSLNPINSDFDLYSSGPDGISKGPLTAKPSHDDLVRASNGSFFGVAVDF